MKFVRFDMQGVDLCRSYFNPGWITSPVQLGADFQTSLGGGVGNQIDDDVMTDQRPAAPVLGDVAEYAMFDLVPFAGSRWEMIDVNGHAQTMKS